MAEPGYDVLEQYEHELKTFVDAMRYKLKVNSRKGKWSNISIDDAFKALQGEVGELRLALKTGNVIESTLEGADVANWAMILVNILLTGKNKFAPDKSGTPIASDFEIESSGKIISLVPPKKGKKPVTVAKLHNFLLQQAGVPPFAKYKRQRKKALKNARTRNKIRR